MKKFLIGGVVAGVIAVIIVVTSMVTGGSDKFVGTWYITGRGWGNYPYINEMQITKNGKDYQVTFIYHKYVNKWIKYEPTNYVAVKSGDALNLNDSGLIFPIKYNENDKTLLNSKSGDKYTKLTISIEELKEQLKSQVQDGLKKKEKEKSTDGLGCTYDRLSDLIKTNKKK